MHCKHNYHTSAGLHWICAIAAALVMSSCAASASGEDTPDGGVPVSFSALTGWNEADGGDNAEGNTAKGTRLAEGTDGLAFEKGDAIGVFAYKNDSSTPDFMNNQKVTYDGTAWSYSPTKYWPQVGDVAFYSFYPFSSSHASDLVEPSVKWENIGNEDIMWAKNETAPSTRPVAFQFQHKLMKIKIKLIKGEGFGENTELTRFDVLGGDDSNKLAKDASLNIRTGELAFVKDDKYTINMLGGETTLSIPDDGKEFCLFTNPLRKIKIALSTSMMDYPDVCIDLLDGDASKFYKVSITIHGTKISVSVNNLWIDNTIGDQIIE